MSIIGEKKNFVQMLGVELSHLDCLPPMRRNGGRRNILFGLPIVRRKSQTITFPIPGMRRKGGVTRHETIRRITRTSWKMMKKVWRRIIPFGHSASSDS
jgi:hypothetical protein